MNELPRRFESAYTRIEHQLKIVCKSDRHLAFYELIDRAIKSNNVVRNFESFLRKVGDLRNVLVHEKPQIAVPTEEAVLKIEAIANVLEHPTKLVSLFSMQVETCTVTELVGSAARIMHDKSFSQLPVVEGSKIVGLLTTETIARWLATQFQKNEGILEDEPIAAVLKHQEKDSTYKVLSREANAFDALATFDEALHAGNDLDAILLTHNGSKNESILGILTPFDIPQLIREVKLNTD